MMKGSLGDVNVSDLVVQIFTARKSGILRLAQNEVKKSLYFKDGSIVFAHSNLKNERLGEILLRLGKITEDEFNSVSGKLQAGTRLGQALYEAGYLAPAEVNAGVSYQIQMIVYSVFNWEQGEYEFQDRERPVFEDIMVENSTPQLIIDGVRNITSLRVLERGVSGLEDHVVILNNGTKRLKRSNLDFSEETILACINGKATVNQLRGISRLSSFEFGRAMYCLSLSDIIRFGKTDKLEDSIRAEPNRNLQAPPLETNPMPAQQGSLDPPRMKTYSEPEIRKLIAENQKKWVDATDEEVLNVLPDSSPDEIMQAYERLASIFHPPYYAADRYNDVKEPLKLIIDRLYSAQYNLVERANVQQPLLPDDLNRAVLTTPEGVADRPETVTAPPPPSTPPAPEQSPAEAENAETSIAALQDVLTREPANTKAMRDLALKLQQVGRPLEAEKQLQRALQIEPRSVDCHYALAAFYQQQGLKFKAFKHYNIILQLDPANQKALEALGVKKRKGGLYDI